MPKLRITRRAVLGSVGASLSSTLAAPAGASLAPVPAQGNLALPQVGRAFAAQLEVGKPAQASGASTQRWAIVLGGAIDGPRLRGVVQGGRIDWLQDPTGESVEVTATFIVRRDDGRLIEVRDRGVYSAANAATASAAICTSPQLVEPAGEDPVSAAVLVGRLDASQLDHGVVRLLAFEVT